MTRSAMFSTFDSIQAQKIIHNGWLTEDQIQNSLSQSQRPSDQDLCEFLASQSLITAAQADSIRASSMADIDQMQTVRTPSQGSGARSRPATLVDPISGRMGSVDGRDLSQAHLSHDQSHASKDSANPDDIDTVRFIQAPKKATESVTHSQLNTAARLQAAEAYQTAIADDPLYAPHSDVVLERQESIGEGGMGQVFRVKDQRLGRDAALKLVSPDKASPNAVLRFMREARLTACLDHPAIPPVYEAGTTKDGEIYMLMKLIRGRTLADCLKSRSYSQRAALEALQRVAEAVAYAHSKGVIHRDLKPANIMVGEFGEVMLMDWGIARDMAEGDEVDFLQAVELDIEEASQAGLTLSGDILGTPGYMSPEQAAGEFASEKSDVFALGALLTEILTGSPPVSGRTVLEILLNTNTHKIETPLMRDRSVSPELNAIAAKALAGPVEFRMASAEDFVEELKAYLSGDMVKSHHYSLTERALRVVRRHPTALAGALFFTFLFGITSLLMMRLEQARWSEQQAQERAERARAAQDMAESSELRIRNTLATMSQAEDLARRGAPLEKLQGLVNKVLFNGGRSYDLLLSCARVYDLANHQQAARLLLREAVRIKTPAYEALYALHELEIKNDGAEKGFRYTEPLQQLEREALARGDENEFSLFSKGVKAIQAKDFKKAVEIYDTILKKYSRSFAWAYSNKAYAHKRLKQWPQAMEALNQAILEDPRYANAYDLRGQIFLQAGEPKRALSDFEMALKYSPKSAAVWNNKGLAHGALKQSDQAYDCYKKAASLSRKLAGPLVNISHILFDKGQYKEAILALDQALEREPNTPSALSNRGIVKMVSGDKEGAIKDFNKVIELAPKDPDGYKNRGIYFQRVGNYQAAIDDFKKILEINPKHRARKEIEGVIEGLKKKRDEAKNQN